MWSYVITDQSELKRDVKTLKIVLQGWINSFIDCHY